MFGRRQATFKFLKRFRIFLQFLQQTHIPVLPAAINRFLENKSVVWSWLTRDTGRRKRDLNSRAWLKVGGFSATLNWPEPPPPLLIPRDAICIARTMLSQDVRLYVRLSVHRTPVLRRNG